MFFMAPCVVWDPQIFQLNLFLKSIDNSLYIDLLGNSTITNIWNFWLKFYNITQYLIGFQLDLYKL